SERVGPSPLPTYLAMVEVKTLVALPPINDDISVRPCSMSSLGLPSRPARPSSSPGDDLDAAAATRSAPLGLSATLARPLKMAGIAAPATPWASLGSSPTALATRPRMAGVRMRSIAESKGDVMKILPSVLAENSPPFGASNVGVHHGFR